MPKVVTGRGDCVGLEAQVLGYVRRVPLAMGYAGLPAMRKGPGWAGRNAFYRAQRAQISGSIAVMDRGMLVVLQASDIALT